ncbi:MAG TPA: hypothetical protein VJZ91_06475 [Blastocatellia bacterium]|nr:hypothetical protein [Blastocatellia bacterium]
MKLAIALTVWISMLFMPPGGLSSLLLTVANDARNGIAAQPDLRSVSPSPSSEGNASPPVSKTDEMDVPAPDVIEGVEVVGWSFVYDRRTRTLVCAITLRNFGEELLSGVEWEMSRELALAAGGLTHATSITCRTVRQISAGDTVTASVRLHVRLRRCGRRDIETLGVSAVRGDRTRFYC